MASATPIPQYRDHARQVDEAPQANVTTGQTAPTPTEPDAANAWREHAHLAQLATAVLNEHTNDNGLCAICGCAFPCESAVLAEHNVAFL